MRFFVTGATGFIGKRLVRKLLASPDNQVWFLLRDASRSRLPELLAYWGADGQRNRPAAYQYVYTRHFAEVVPWLLINKTTPSPWPVLRAAQLPAR